MLTLRKVLLVRYCSFRIVYILTLLIYISIYVTYLPLLLFIFLLSRYDHRRMENGIVKIVKDILRLPSVIINLLQRSIGNTLNGNENNELKHPGNLDRYFVFESATRKYLFINLIKIVIMRTRRLISVFLLLKDNSRMDQKWIGFLDGTTIEIEDNNLDVRQSTNEIKDTVSREIASHYVAVVA